MSLSDDIKLLVEVRQPKHHEEGWDSLVSVGVSFRYEYSLKSEVHKNLLKREDFGTEFERIRATDWQCHNGKKKEAELKKLLRNVKNS